MADPITFDDVLARLDALESGLTLQQLPLEPLKTFLENDWQPDSGLLLQPKSVTPDLLASNVLPGRGVGTLTWAGVTSRSNFLTVPHGLGVVPANIQITHRRQTGFVTVDITVDDPAPDATNFTVSGITQNASVPGAGATSTFYWAAWV